MVQNLTIDLLTSGLVILAPVSFPLDTHTQHKVLLLHCFATYQHTHARMHAHVQHMHTHTHTHTHTLTVSFYGGTYTVIRPPSQSLHASFHFSTAHGALLVADIEHITGYLALTLNNGTLEATLSGGDERLQSLLSLSVDSTHTLQRYLELSVSEDQVMLTLDGDSVRTNLSSRLNFSGWVNLAGPPSGNSSVYSSLISAGSYVGCMLNVTINSHSVELDGDIQVGYSSGCCIPPRRTPLRQSINYDQYPWNNISVQVSAVAVDEADNVTITDLNLGLLIPEDLINSETGYWLRSEVESRIVFDIVSEPQFGFFTRGLSNARISTFRFSDLLSDDSITRVSIL